MIFRDDYLKFKIMLVQGAFIYIKARVQKRPWNDQLEIKILSINLLSDVVDKLIKSITLRLNLYDLNTDFINKFKEIIKIHHGDHQLNFSVFDPDNSLYLDFLSRSHKVRISKQLVEDVSRLGEVQYKLN